MTDVNVTEFRQNLPAYLDRAKHGERIRVTSRGEVIAELSGPKAADDEAEIIRGRLRGSVLHNESPAAPAQSAAEWTVNQGSFWAPTFWCGG